MEIFLESLCRGLVGRGVKCEVIVARDPGDPSEEMSKGVIIRRMRSLGTIKSLSVCPAAFGILRHAQADIINLHHPNPLADLSYLISRPKGRLVVTYHSDIIDKPWINHLYSVFLHKILDIADAIIATSPQYVTSSPVLNRYQKKIRIIPLGFDLPQIRTGSVYFNESNRPPQYMFVGRLVPYKGISVMMEALREIPGGLWVVGTGPLQEKLKSEATSANLGYRVEFLGNISEEEKFQRLAACDALILPSISRAEAFGMVLLEAMAVGCPVVVSDLPTGVRLLVQNGVNGYRFPPGDAKALAAVLRRMAHNREEARQMGSAGRRLVQEKYATDLMVNRYFAVYQEILN